MSKIRFTVVFSICMIPGIIWSQQYKTAVGIRLASEKGISIQQTVGNKITFEGLMTAPDNGGKLNFSVIAEKHINLIGRHINAYLGLGPQVSLVSKNNQDSRNAIGANAISGLEWTIRRLNCSFDVKPLLQLTGKSSEPLIKWQTAFTVRYVIVRRDNIFQRAKKKIMRLT